MAGVADLDALKRMARGLKDLPPRVSVAVEDAGFRVTLPDGRTQAVEAWQEGDHWVFSSVVVGKRRLDGLAWSELARLVWPRNLRTPLVGFQLDDRGRLVGRAETPVGTLDGSELGRISLCSLGSVIGWRWF
jgi:hypothetical protein